MALPLTINQDAPIYGGAVHLARQTCRCGNKIGWHARRCRSCERGDLKHYDYEGSGAQIISAHGPRWHAHEAHRSDISSKIDCGNELRQVRKAAKVSMDSMSIICGSKCLPLVETGINPANERILIAYAALALCPRAVKRQIGGAA